MSKGDEVSKINRGSGLWRGGSVLEGRVQVRGGVRRPHALPSRVRSARGGGFILLRPTAPPGIIRPGILARQPCNGCGSCSLNAPFLDPRGHQRACTGKRPVPRGEAHSAYNSGGDEAPFTSGVPHHTPPDLAVSAPLLSHTPTPVGSLVKDGD